MKRNIEVVLFIVATVIIGSSAVNYCRISSCGNTPHTACTYTNPGPSARCTNVQSSGLTNDEKQRIVNLHNQLRQKVASGKETRGSPGPQPSAKSMPNLVWDDEIASIAQLWANQCNWGHDSCRDVERFSVGQNLAFMGTTENVNTIKVDSMVNMWYNEVKDFSRDQVKRFMNKGAGGRVVGHYTQLVWAASTKIGCGGVKYKDGKFNKFYLVCNYGPTGNWLREPLYDSR